MNAENTAEAPHVHGRGPRAAWATFVVLAVVVATLLRAHSLADPYPFFASMDEEAIASSSLKILGSGNPVPSTMSWPALQFYLNSAGIGVQYVAGRLAGVWHGVGDLRLHYAVHPTMIAWPGRLLAWVLSVGTVLLAFRLGSALGGRPAGAVAMVLLGASWTAAAEASTILPDTTMVFLATLSLYLCVLAIKTGRVRTLAWAVILLCVAAAAKYNAAYAAAAILAAGLLSPQIRSRLRDGRVLAKLAGVSLVGAALFAALSGFAFAPSAYLSIWASRAQIQSQTWIGFSPDWTPWWPIGVLLERDAPLVVLGLLGLVIALASRSREAGALGAGLVAWLAMTGTSRVIMPHYCMPAAPMLACLAGVGVAFALQRVRKKAVAVVAVAALGAQLCICTRAALASYRESQLTDTRLQMADYIHVRIRDGARMAIWSDNYGPPVTSSERLDLIRARIKRNPYDWAPFRATYPRAYDLVPLVIRPERTRALPVLSTPGEAAVKSVDQLAKEKVGYVVLSSQDCERFLDEKWRPHDAVPRGRWDQRNRELTALLSDARLRLVHRVTPAPSASRGPELTLYALSPLRSPGTAP